MASSFVGIPTSAESSQKKGLKNISATERSQKNARAGICQNWRFFSCGLILQPLSFYL
jgi:hypothetical protein